MIAGHEHTPKFTIPRHGDSRIQGSVHFHAANVEEVPLRGDVPAGERLLPAEVGRRPAHQGSRLALVGAR